MIYNGESVKTAVALGFFDGLHIAHMSVLDNTAAEKNGGLLPCVLLFNEHPAYVLSGREVSLLLQNEKRDEILKEKGLVSVCKNFSEIKDMSPDEFFEKILIRELDAAAVSCGYNYRFGKNGAGDTEKLKELCNKYGVKLKVCEEITADGKQVSSTRIRKLIENGEMKEANKLLGRNFGFSAEVFSGDHRGRLLGTPTINQYLPEKLTVPAFGVYVSEVYLDGKCYMGVTNIGVRPTFGLSNVRSETYILDFNGDLYGKCIELSLLEFVRPEMKFASFDELKEQIKKDEKKVRIFQKKC